MRRSIIAGTVLLAIVASVPATARRTKDDDEGVKVRRASIVRNLVPAASLEKAALQQYGQLRAQAVGRNALVAEDDAQAKRVQRIAKELLPHTYKWNTRAKDWPWEVIVVKTPAINALCMPGGKIAVFTGILDTLKLTDDELAMVLGHEMAHALREHARGERRGIDRHTLLLGVHHADQIVRPRQAAGMGGEKAFGAADHDFALSSVSNCSSSLSAPSTLALISAEASSPSRSSSASTRRE